MKILHIALLSHFTCGMAYQDNVLVEINAADGHDVTIISDTMYYKDGVLTDGEEEDIILPDGVRLIRLKYDRIVNSFITEKIQKVNRLYSIIESIQPDSILYHGYCGYEIMRSAKYKKRHPNVKFYVDSHEDFNNTARTFLSKTLYRFIHGFFVKRANKYIDKILYITEETKDFLIQMYHPKADKLEYFPLGGMIPTPDELRKSRQYVISKHSLDENCVICVHSGKLSEEKKSCELLRAFCRNENRDLRLFIIGTIPDTVKETLLPLIEGDSRICYLGWQSGTTLQEYLRGGDVYIQPGTQSSTFQTALCSNCALIVDSHKSHVALLGEEYGLYASSENEIFDALNKLDGKILEETKNKLFAIAKDKLDYKKLANRYLHS